MNDAAARWATDGRDRALARLTMAQGQLEDSQVRLEALLTQEAAVDALTSLAEAHQRWFELVEVASLKPSTLQGIDFALAHLVPELEARRGTASPRGAVADRGFRYLKHVIVTLRGMRGARPRPGPASTRAGGRRGTRASSGCSKGCCARSGATPRRPAGRGCGTSSVRSGSARSDAEDVDGERVPIERTWDSGVEVGRDGDVGDLVKIVLGLQPSARTFAQAVEADAGRASTARAERDLLRPAAARPVRWLRRARNAGIVGIAGILFYAEPVSEALGVDKSDVLMLPQLLTLAATGVWAFGKGMFGDLFAGRGRSSGPMGHSPIELVVMRVERNHQRFVSERVAAVEASGKRTGIEKALNKAETAMTIAADELVEAEERLAALRRPARTTPHRSCETPATIATRPPRGREAGASLEQAAERFLEQWTRAELAAWMKSFVRMHARWLNLLVRAARKPKLRERERSQQALVDLEAARNVLRAAPADAAPALLYLDRLISAVRWAGTVDAEVIPQNERLLEAIELLGEPKAIPAMTGDLAHQRAAMQLRAHGMAGRKRHGAAAAVLGAGLGVHLDPVHDALPQPGGSGGSSIDVLMAGGVALGAVALVAVTVLLVRGRMLRLGRGARSATTAPMASSAPARAPPPPSLLSRIRALLKRAIARVGVAVAGLVLVLTPIFGFAQASADPIDHTIWQSVENTLQKEENALAKHQGRAPRIVNDNPAFQPEVYRQVQIWRTEHPDADEYHLPVGYEFEPKPVLVPPVAEAPAPSPEQPRPEQPRPEQPRPEQPRPEQPRPEQPHEAPAGKGVHPFYLWLSGIAAVWALTRFARKRMAAKPLREIRKVRRDGDKALKPLDRNINTLSEQLYEAQQANDVPLARALRLRLDRLNAERASRAAEIEQALKEATAEASKTITSKRRLAAAAERDESWVGDALTNADSASFRVQLQPASVGLFGGFGTVAAGISGLMAGPISEAFGVDKSDVLILPLLTLGATGVGALANSVFGNRFGLKVAVKMGALAGAAFMGVTVAPAFWFLYPLFATAGLFDAAEGIVRGVLDRRNKSLGRDTRVQAAMNLSLAVVPLMFLASTMVIGIRWSFFLMGASFVGLSLLTSWSLNANKPEVESPDDPNSSRSVWLRAIAALRDAMFVDFRSSAKRAFSSPSLVLAFFFGVPLLQIVNAIPAGIISGPIDPLVEANLLKGSQTEHWLEQVVGGLPPEITGAMAEAQIGLVTLVVLTLNTVFRLAVVRAMGIWQKQMQRRAEREKGQTLTAEQHARRIRQQARLPFRMAAITTAALVPFAAWLVLDPGLPAFAALFLVSNIAAQLVIATVLPLAPTESSQTRSIGGGILGFLVGQAIGKAIVDGHPDALEATDLAATGSLDTTVVAWFAATLAVLVWLSHRMTRVKGAPIAQLRPVLPEDDGQLTIDALIAEGVHTIGGLEGLTRQQLDGMLTRERADEVEEALDQIGKQLRDHPAPGWAPWELRHANKAFRKAQRLPLRRHEESAKLLDVAAADLERYDDNHERDARLERRGSAKDAAHVAGTRSPEMFERIVSTWLRVQQTRKELGWAAAWHKLLAMRGEKTLIVELKTERRLSPVQHRALAAIARRNIRVVIVTRLPAPAAYEAVGLDEVRYYGSDRGWQPEHGALDSKLSALIERHRELPLEAAGIQATLVNGTWKLAWPAGEQLPDMVRDIVEDGEKHGLQGHWADGHEAIYVASRGSVRTNIDAVTLESAGRGAVALVGNGLSLLDALEHVESAGLVERAIRFMPRDEDNSMSTKLAVLERVQTYFGPDFRREREAEWDRLERYEQDADVVLDTETDTWTAIAVLARLVVESDPNPRGLRIRERFAPINQLLNPSAHGRSPPATGFSDKQRAYRSALVLAGAGLTLLATAVVEALVGGTDSSSLASDAIHNLGDALTKPVVLARPRVSVSPRTSRSERRPGGSNSRATSWSWPSRRPACSPPGTRSSSPATGTRRRRHSPSPV